MNVRHELQITSICPVDDKPDVYLCIVEAQRVIPVEKIVEVTAYMKDQKMYQEDMCQEIHRTLACAVTLIGYHSGVKTTVTCGGVA